ncbi:MAG TPA: C1 family peptidase [Candidatus Limnocylindrales bacterium]|jgi:C1A family cysteine protease
MNSTREGYGLGWLPDHPDFRDHSASQGVVPSGGKRDVPALLNQLSVADPAAGLPPSIDLRAGFSPIEDQGNLGSCTANAGVGVLEYFEQGATGRHLDASRLFLYKATRNLMGESGDTGAFLRTTMQALVLFGVPPEEYWPYDVTAFDNEPTAFCYAFGQSYRTVQYYRLDSPDVPDRETLLARIKTNLAAKLPSMFGFTVYSSYVESRTNGGAFPYPLAGERRVGGHAIVAAGYDDTKRIQGIAAGAPETTGALLIRNSWGTGWGDGGYGWLPYEYVLASLAQDWWSLIKADWVDSGVFGLSS